MRLGSAFVVLRTALVLQVSSHAAGPRIAPGPEGQRTDQQQSLAAKFASSGMRNAVGTDLRYHPALAEHILPLRALRLERLGAPAPSPFDSSACARSGCTRSNYLWAHRVGTARQAGLTDEELKRIAHGAEAKGWDVFESTLLRAADELHVDSFVPDATWRATATRYDTNQLVDVVDTVGAVTLHAGAINSLGVEVEADPPDRFPTGIPYAVAARRTNLRLIGREARIPLLGPDEWTPEQRKRFDPNGAGRAPRMSSSRSCAIHRPTACAARSISTSSTRRPCPFASGSCC